ncbi:MAG: leucine-rich repeat domain-containing protein [Eubacterium sp.]
MKKVISLFLSVAMLLSIVSVVDFSAYADVQTGSCGDNVKYSLDTETGVLTISGTGEMTDSPFRQNFNFNIIKSVIIKNGVTSISDYAFYSCSSLASVTIPNSVTNIGDGAFKWSGITNITIPDSVTSIGDGAFEWSGITNITIPDSVTNIGICTFFFCKKLNFVSIPNSVTSIGSEAFYCTSLTSIKIPDSVTSIGDSAFAGCENLKNIAIGSGVLSIGENAFSGTGYYNDKSNWNNGTLYISDCLIDIDNDFNSIDDYTIKENTRVIADQAFFDCANLSSINVSNNNKNYSSNDGVLFNKSQTELITYPADKADSKYIIPNSVMTIDKYAFYGCRNLIGVTIPETLTSIDEFSFFNCASIESINIPNSVKNICQNSFNGCTSLKNVIIPNSITNISVGAFGNCQNVKNVYFTGTQEEWKKINIEIDNDSLEKANIYYGFVPCTENQHNYYGEWQIIEEPTCTKTGLKQRTCKLDGYLETVVISALGHNFSNNAKACLNGCGAANPNYVAPVQHTTTPTILTKPEANLKSASIKKVKAAKKAISVIWKKVGGVKGYQVQVATDKKFKKNKKTVTIKKQKTTKTTVKKLKAKKKYYVRVRTYKIVNGKKVYSSWSKVKSVKTK